MIPASRIEGDGLEGKPRASGDDPRERFLQAMADL